VTIHPQYPDSDRRRLREHARILQRHERRTDHVVQLTGAASHTFSFLNGDSERIYTLELYGRLTSAAADRVIRLLPNGDATAANYRHLLHRAYDDAGVKAHDVVDFMPMGGLVVGSNGWAESSDVFVTARVYAATGRSRASISTHLLSNFVTPDRALRSENAAYWTDTTTVITSLVLDFQNADTTFTGTAALHVGG